MRDYFRQVRGRGGNCEQRRRAKRGPKQRTHRQLLGKAPRTIRPSAREFNEKVRYVPKWEMLCDCGRIYNMQGWLLRAAADVRRAKQPYIPGTFINRVPVRGFPSTYCFSDSARSSRAIATTLGAIFLTASTR
jgi:hypothetical protein